MPSTTLGLTIEVVAAVWCFYLGAAIGSFANVVAWRLPRRIPFALSTSKCPNCGRGIRFSDNIPVLGWLLLRGRCRYCKSPISIRYFLVEVVYGGVFLLLYFLELRLGGINLPGYEIMTNPDALPWPWLTQPKLLAFFAYHATLLSILGVIWLIQFQGDPVPGRLWCFGVFVGIGSAAFCPWLYLSQWPAKSEFHPSWATGVFVGMLGLGGGALADLVATRVPELLARFRGRGRTKPRGADQSRGPVARSLDGPDPTTIHDCNDQFVPVAALVGAFLGPMVPLALIFLGVTGRIALCLIARRKHMAPLVWTTLVCFLAVAAIAGGGRWLIGLNL